MNSIINPTNRRSFIHQATAASVLLASSQAIHASDTVKLSTNQYSWVVFYRRENRDFLKELDAGLKEVAACKIQAFEPSVSSTKEIDTLEPLLKKHNLDMPSLYTGSVLHEKDKADNSINNIVEIAKRAHDIGAKIIVTNPNPIRWGSEEAKTDDQLKFQAEKLSELGSRISKLGMILAYHNHDPEMKHSAREFHHMMLSTGDEMALCLDAHWVFRGADDSQVALFDIVKLYGKRIVELHLRQSHHGVWSETFTDGDIDYRRLAAMLLELNINPNLVLEVAVENGTPHTMNTAAAHQKSASYTRDVFSHFSSS